MDLEVVTIGTELVLGQTIDTNAAYLARALAAAGVRVVRKTSVADEPALMRDDIAGGLSRPRVVVTSGGLGPTRDDRIRQVVADLCGVPLVTDAGYLAHLEARWRRLYRPGAMPEANRTQAQRPEGAVILPNRRGSAPGLITAIPCLDDSEPTPSSSPVFSHLAFKPRVCSSIML